MTTYDTTITSQQTVATLDLLKAKGMNPDRYKGILASGLLADLLDSAADLSNRDAFRAALKLSSLQPEAPKPLFTIVGTTNIAATPEKKTSKCLVGPRYHTSRDADIDRWLPAVQPKADACIVTTLAPSRSARFTEWAVALPGITADVTDFALISTQLKANGYTFKSLVQLEEMVEASERSEPTGMRTDGWGNFGFVENADGSVSVAAVHRVDPRWDSHVSRFDYGPAIVADYRLLVCNLDATKLGL